MTVLYQTFVAQANLYEDKAAIITPTGQQSYRSLLELVNSWADVIGAACGSETPRVALMTGDITQSISVALELAKLGGVCIPCNAQLQAEQLRVACQACEVNLVLCATGRAHALVPVLQDEFCVWVGDEPATTVPSSTERLPQAPVLASTPDVPADGAVSPVVKDPQADFLIALSSGSTGAPKPVVMSQACKLARAQQTHALYGVNASDVVLCASPFFHSLGQRLSFVPLTCGATLVALPQFTPEKWVAAVAAHKVSFVIAVSAHLYALKEALLSAQDVLASLRVIVSSSAPIDAAFKQTLFESLGCEFHEIYGATEVAIVTNLSPQQAVTKHQTVGMPCAGVRVRVVDDQGSDCATGEVGEILVSSPLMFTRYDNQPAVTAASVREGWFATGDLGVLDADHYLSYVGRKKDVIICGGMNVYPKDIETVLLERPQVREVAVVGVSDQRLGEVIVAVCVGSMTPREEVVLRQLCNQRLAAFQRPLKYYFWERLPVTATGKVSKLAIRETLEAEVEDLTGPLGGILYGAGMGVRGG